MAAEHVPTLKDRKSVYTMASFGIPQEEIARTLRISAPTLRKHFAREIESAATRANAAVARSLFVNATAKNNVTAQIFWLKARAGWKEAAQDVNLNGRLVHAGRADLTGYSDAELLILQRILERKRREAAAVDAAPVAAIGQGRESAPTP